jgi:hypothetical protein
MFILLASNGTVCVNDGARLHVPFRSCVAGTHSHCCCPSFARMLTLVAAQGQPASSNHPAFRNEKHVSIGWRSWSNALRSSQLRFKEQKRRGASFRVRKGRAYSALQNDFVEGLVVFLASKNRATPRRNALSGAMLVREHCSFRSRHLRQAIIWIIVIHRCRRH